MNKGIATLVVLLGILGALLVGGGVYFGWRYYSNQVEPSNPTPTAKVDETTDWQTYNNTDFGYTIKYPQTWYFYKAGFNPPPPAGIFLANKPEGTAPLDYSSFTINVDSELNVATADEYGEVTSLVSQGDTKTKATVSGQNAVKLKGVDTIGTTGISYYVIYKAKMYRLSYQFPKNQAGQEEVCEKILKTFKFTGASTALDLSSGNIQLGPVIIGDLSSLQAAADKGEQASYLDPAEVARIEGKKLGFRASDTYKFISKEYAEAAGTFLAIVEVTHDGKVYTVQLIQPQKQGNAGIWAINSVTAK